MDYSTGSLQFSSPFTLNKLHKSLIRLHMEYASPVWDPFLAGHLKSNKYGTVRKHTHMHAYTLRTAHPYFCLKGLIAIVEAPNILHAYN